MLRKPVAFIVIAISSIVVIPQLQPSLSAHAEDKEGFEATRVKEYVEQLASRNKKPPLAYSRGISLPMFPADYDWSEERRVRKVYNLLEDNFSDSVWKELVSHINDERFALISATENLRGQLTVGKVYSVGNLCREIAQHHLCVSERHVHILNIKGESLINVKCDDLLTNRLTFYDAQVKFCERLEKTVREFKGMEVVERPQMVANLQLELHTLRESKQPRLSPLRRAFKMFPKDFDYRKALPASERD